MLAPEGCSISGGPVTVFLDPGHGGGSDPSAAPSGGAAGLSVSESTNSPEREQMLDVANRIKALLEADGYNVILSRTTNTERKNLWEKGQAAEDAKANIAVSLHSTPPANYSDWMIAGQKVGNYRTDGSLKRTFDNEETATKSQEYAEKFKTARETAEGRTGMIIDHNYGGSFGQDRGLSTYGNIAIVALQAQSVPWVYNEIPQDAGNGSVSESMLEAYAQGIYNGIKSSVPLSSSSSGGGDSEPADGSGYSSAQMINFAKQPIDTTWGVSDSTVEEWFLTSAPGGKPAINRYGLNSSNIGDITAAVKAAGVSPVFFYSYTNQEGGGAGGFINHYGSEASGGGVGNATRDAEYLASQSQKMDSNPSWADAGNYVDFVPEDVKLAGNTDFQNMPAGTIGRAYIPATAAATWEVYYPNGLLKEYNQVQNYGAPLQGVMKNIVEMGGNPLQGGSNKCSESNTLGGSIAEVAMQMQDWGTTYQGCYTWGGGHGASQEWVDQAIAEHFNGGHQSGLTYTNTYGTVSKYGVDCSAFASIVIYKATGYWNGGWTTTTMCSDTTNFEKVTDPQPGDMSLDANCSQHVEVIVGVADGKVTSTVGSNGSGICDNGNDIYIPNHAYDSSGGYNPSGATYLRYKGQGAL
jgi:hypothetical protein